MSLYLGTTKIPSLTVGGVLAAPDLKMGVVRPEAELVATWSHDALWITDDEYTFPSYTTTSTTVHTGAAITPTYTLDLTTYWYYILERALTIPIYNTETKEKGRPDYSITSGMYEIIEIPGNTFSTLSGTKKTSRVTGVNSAGTLYRMPYWTSASAMDLYTSSSYGIHQTVAAPTLSSASSASPKLTIKEPNLITKGSSSYWSSSAWSTLTDIRRQYIIELYRIPKTNSTFEGWGLYSQTLHIVDCIDSTNHILT